MRYIPLPENVRGINVSLKEVNISIVSNLTISSSERQAIVITQHSPMPLDIFLYTIFIVSLAFMVIMIFLYFLGSQRILSSPIYIGRKTSSDNIPIVLYVYDGIKKVLREYYIRIRNSIGCRNCTPREIAIETRIEPLKFFAHVYEDVVYGSRAREDINNAIDKVKEFLEKNE